MGNQDAATHTHDSLSSLGSRRPSLAGDLHESGGAEPLWGGSKRGLAEAKMCIREPVWEKGITNVVAPPIAFAVSDIGDPSCLVAIGCAAISDFFLVAVWRRAWERRRGHPQLSVLGTSPRWPPPRCSALSPLFCAAPSAVAPPEVVCCLFCHQTTPSVYHGLLLGFFPGYDQGQQTPSSYR